MPRIKYIDWTPAPISCDRIEKANMILEEYATQGFDLTLRQLFYQFVSRDYLPNTGKSYDNLGVTINAARLAGLVDWNHITDRTRELESLPYWDSPSEIIESCADEFQVNMWEEQAYYIEVWIEKEALAGVIASICEKYRVPYFSCRGYTSQSELWRAAQRLLRKKDEHGKKIRIVHLGDHDPSGIDMTRDIQDRLNLFMDNGTKYGARVNRIALNMDQIMLYKPPPNPTKITDSRASNYISEYGDDCWELDALEPKVIQELIKDEIEPLIDYDKWDESAKKEQAGRDQLTEIANDLIENG